MNKLTIPASLIFLAGLASAQLTQQQQQHDFQNLAAVYAKRYAPHDWKKRLLGVDLFDLGPWMERVRNAKNDLDYFEIAAQYVAQLDDLHSSYRLPSSFAANAGFAVDIYDSKVLVESINRTQLPAGDFPFQVGDELVSVDGKPVELLIEEFSKLRRRGNPSTTRRAAADLITFRSQAFVPRAVELSDASTMQFRRADGTLETYQIPWVKTGIALTKVGPVSNPRAANSAERWAGDYWKPWQELTNYQVFGDDHLLQGETWSANPEQTLSRRYVLGWGARAPTFTFPSNFEQRLGRIPAHFHFSGIYQAEGRGDFHPSLSAPGGCGTTLP